MEELTLIHPSDTQTSCRHHWLIDPVAGAQSRGRCTNCGLERDFLNVFEDVLEAQQAAHEEAPAAA